MNCNMLKINGECLTVDSFDELRFLKGPENEPLSRDVGCTVKTNSTNVY